MVLRLSDIILSSDDERRDTLTNEIEKNESSEAKIPNDPEDANAQRKKNKKIKQSKQKEKQITSFYTMTQHLSEIVQQTDDPYLKSNFMPTGAAHSHNWNWVYYILF